MLAFYDPNKEVQLVIDASNHALGAVLLQHDDDHLRPICYISRSLTPAELKYSITEKEALSLVWAIEKLLNSLTLVLLQHDKCGRYVLYHVIST